MGKKKVPALEGAGGEDGRRPTIERIGLFTESYLKFSPTTVPKRPQEAGKQFTTSPAKEDIYFSQKYTRAFEGEAYSDMVLVRRAYRREQSQKNLVPAGFRPSNVTPRASGKGSIYGTLTHQYPLKDAKEPLAPRSPPEKAPPESRRNFYTSPPKVGGYGYLEGTIGKAPGYMPSPYDLEQKLNSEAREMSKKKCVDAKPFIGSSHEKPYFDNNPFTGASPFTIGARNSSKAPATPWKPPSQSQPYLNAFPEYQAPYPHPPKAEIEAQVREQVEADKAARSAAGPLFKPVGTSCHSHPMTSLVELGVPRAPSTRLRAMMQALKPIPQEGANSAPREISHAFPTY
ncbi:hypothetical protein AMAG_07190 [Allomyces macrogynus ATCC 38327]|uniref:Cilia-and flagella-associated protein 96 n=1 Tax=Allomyces macrogynus (strain ATCC 38327) TaxID=578462 RepID=A0A0L0SHE7_ALLM3|nr:hypothetical protein AMAG_07190 [Allomyces macrogynus ATCC 38327]|eukprot:KNE61921.1 hypothetical protein AMAG_07190 [Allomyces macrogynus ATCC 38327]